MLTYLHTHILGGLGCWASGSVSRICLCGATLHLLSSAETEVIFLGVYYKKREVLVFLNYWQSGLDPSVQVFLLNFFSV